MSDIIDAVLELAGDTTFLTEDGFIDRKSVIDFLSGIENLDPKTKGSIVMYIESLPAVQPDHIADIGKKASISYDHENDLVSWKAAIEAINGMIDRFERLLADIRESKVDDSVCGMCEYDGAYMGQSGDWCNECPGFDKDDCFKLSDRCRKRWMGDIVLPSAQPEYEPVTAEEFAKTMSENTLYGFMAWHGEALALMNEMGFVICKKT